MFNKSLSSGTEACGSSSESDSSDSSGNSNNSCGTGPDSLLSKREYYTHCYILSLERALLHVCMLSVANLWGAELAHAPPLAHV